MQNNTVNMDTETKQQAVFRSRKGWLIYFPLAIFPFLFSFVLLKISKESPEDLIPVFCVFTFVFISLLSLLKTSYQVENNQLTIRCSIFRKRIQISDIQKLSTGNHIWFLGWKYALSTKGVVISAQKHMDILISPQDEERFVQLLKHINPEIQVEDLIKR